MYGFDCGHYKDKFNPIFMDIKWLVLECERMALGISIAAKYEPSYLLAQTSEEKSIIINNYHKKLNKLDSSIEFKLEDNYGAMIEFLFKNNISGPGGGTGRR